MVCSTGDKFDIGLWFDAFVRWLRKCRAAEAIEILSDCSNELYLNSVTALHLRHHGHERGLQHFWSRCEWGKTDICYGMADAPFRNWEQGYADKTIGYEGSVEGKVLYWGYSAGKCAEILRVLDAQLQARREENERYGALP